MEIILIYSIFHLIYCSIVQMIRDSVLYILS